MNMDNMELLADDCFVDKCLEIMPNVYCLGGIRSVETDSQVWALRWLWLVTAMDAADLSVMGLVRLTASFELLFSA